MPAKGTPSLPKSFWVVGILALIWNVMGILNFFAQVTMSEEALAALPPEEQALYDIPMWVTALFAVAVFSGTLGSLGLLLKKGWAVPVFVVSLICVVIQMGYSVLMSPALEMWGPSALVLPLMVTGVALFLWWYSRSATRKGWLS